MIDTIAALWFFAFFGFLTYAIYKSPNPTPEPPAPMPPSPVQLFCSICRVPAALVTNQEYVRISQAGIFIHCTDCLRTIEGYKKQAGGIS